MISRSYSRFEKISSRVSAQECKVLSSSAKLQILVLTMKIKRSLIKMLNNRGPSIEPCGTPRVTFDQSLNLEPTLNRSLVTITQVAFHKIKTLMSSPNASSFATKIL